VNSYSHHWALTPYNLGMCAEWTPENRRTHYMTLCKPDDRIYFAGEHMSYIGCWMAGAFEASRAAVQALHTRALSNVAYGERSLPRRNPAFSGMKTGAS